MDDSSIFLLFRDHRVTTETLNKELSKVAQWVHQWKVFFNPKLSKQVQEIVFSRKNRATSHGGISANSMITNRENVLKYLGLLLDAMLNFVEHLDAQIKIAKKGISLLRKLHLS